MEVIHKPGREACRTNVKSESRVRGGASGTVVIAVDRTDNSVKPIKQIPSETSVTQGPSVGIDRVRSVLKFASVRVDSRRDRFCLSDHPIAGSPDSQWVPINAHLRKSAASWCWVATTPLQQLASPLIKAVVF